MERRQFLAVGATLVTASQAGCTGLLGDASSLSASDVSDWLIEPGAIDSGLSQYQFEATSPSGLSEQSDDPLLSGVFAPDTAFGSVTASDVDLDLSYSGGGLDVSIYQGTFDAEWIGQTIRSDDSLNPDRSYEGMEIFSSDSGQFAIGIDDNTAIEITHRVSSPDAAGFVRALIDTEAGETRRYTESSRDMETLIDQLPDGHELRGQTFNARDQTNAPQGVFRNQVAAGRSRTIDGEVTDERRVLVFTNENDIIDREMQEYIDSGSAFRNYRSRPDYDIDGRTVTIEGTRPTDFF